MAIVLIGPPAAGKTSVGELLAIELDREFVDIDEVAAPYYAERGWSVYRLQQLATDIGYETAHEQWEGALAHAVERTLAVAVDAVVALGAGHTHLTSPELFNRVRAALDEAEAVVLLRPGSDPAKSIRVLRQRCLESKGHDWRTDGIDWLERWTTHGRDELLATIVVDSNAEGLLDTARRLRGLVQERGLRDRCCLGGP